MLKILKSKKGFNDTSILAVIVSIFILIGAFLPYINEEFDTSFSTADTDTLEGDVGDNIDSVSSLNAFTVILSIIKMFFWTFGDLPVWLEIGLFLPMRLIFVFLVARNIWIGGGG